MNRSLGYIGLLRTNRDFRYLWLGQAVSLLGDWFNSIALLTLVHRLTGSGLLVGGVFIARMIPSFLLGPAAGMVADRLNRRSVMIVTDILRAVVVLLFLLVQDGRDIWLLYAILFLSMSIATFFDPARSAAIPNIVSRRQLLIANALGGATWCIMLAIGSALGGVVVATAGYKTVFLLDSATFLLSAWFVSRAGTAYCNALLPGDHQVDPLGCGCRICHQRARLPGVQWGDYTIAGFILDIHGTLRRCIDVGVLHHDTATHRAGSFSWSGICR